jgi:hypothetical protein
VFAFVCCCVVLFLFGVLLFVFEFVFWLFVIFVCLCCLFVLFCALFVLFFLSLTTDCASPRMSDSDGARPTIPSQVNEWSGNTAL